MPIQPRDQTPVEVRLPESIIKWRPDLKPINESAGVFLFGEKLPLQKGEPVKILVGKENGPVFSVPEKYVKEI